MTRTAYTKGPGAIDTSASLVEVFLSHEGRVSDKWEQYLGIYEAELSRFATAGRPVRLLEVGVQNAGSLEIWSRYFPAGSLIVGVDIDPACARISMEQNVKILIADAGDPRSIDSALGEQTFDIIIDDGSHRSGDIVATFQCCFPRLEGGGVYIIEDLHTSYWPSMDGGLRQPGTAIEWLKGLVDALNSDHFDASGIAGEDLEKLRVLNGQISRLSFFDSVAIVEKRSVDKSGPYRRFFTGEDAGVWQAFKVIAAGSADAARGCLFSESASRAMSLALFDQLGAEREDSRALRVSLASKEASVAKLRNWMRQTARMLNDSRARIEELDSTLRKTVDDCARAQASANELSKYLAGTRSQLREAFDDLVNARAEADKARAEVLAMYASTSWRVTAPLRWLGRHSRGARRRGGDG